MASADVIKGLNELKQEVAGWEHRRDALKSEIDSLKRAKESSEKEIADKRVLFVQEVESKMLDMRTREQALREGEAKLKADKDEFAAMLAGFKSDKAGLEKAREIAENTRKTYEEATAKVGRFILLVKREAESL